MRNLIISLMAMVVMSATLNAQEDRIVKKFNYIHTESLDGKEVEEAFEGTNTFIFNYGEGSDLLIYWADGSKELYTRITGWEEDKFNNTGREYSMASFLDEDGYRVDIITTDDDETTFIIYSDSRLIFSKYEPLHYREPSNSGFKTTST